MVINNEFKIKNLNNHELNKFRSGDLLNYFTLHSIM